jgi:hypothetical protein
MCLKSGQMHFHGKHTRQQTQNQNAIQLWCTWINALSAVTDLNRFSISLVIYSNTTYFSHKTIKLYLLLLFYVEVFELSIWSICTEEMTQHWTKIPMQTHPKHQAV